MTNFLTTDDYGRGITVNINTFSFIGAGNMGAAMAEGVCRTAGPKNVTVFDSDAEKMQDFALKTGCRSAAFAAAAAESSHFVFLCVKPGLLPDVLRNISPALKKAAESGVKKIVVSIAAGVGISAIESILNESGIPFPVIRLMPNTPVSVGKGLILLSKGAGISEEDEAALTAALAPCGHVAQIDESYIDAATPVSGCAPAFAYMFIEALADGAVMSGLPRDMAQSFAARAALGAAAMVLETGRCPGELKDAVCSPGGSTIAGVEELERLGFRSSAASAVLESYKRTRQLGE